MTKSLGKSPKSPKLCVNRNWPGPLHSRLASDSTRRRAIQLTPIDSGRNLPHAPSIEYLLRCTVNSRIHLSLIHGFTYHKLSQGSSYLLSNLVTSNIHVHSQRSERAKRHFHADHITSKALDPWLARVVCYTFAKHMLHADFGTCFGATHESVRLGR